MKWVAVAVPEAVHDYPDDVVVAPVAIVLKTSNTGDCRFRRPFAHPSPEISHYYIRRTSHHRRPPGIKLETRYRWMIDRSI